MALGTGVLVPLMSTLPVSFCANGTLVMLKRFVFAVKCPAGLDSLKRYCPAMFCMKSPF